MGADARIRIFSQQSQSEGVHFLSEGTFDPRGTAASVCFQKQDGPRQLAIPGKQSGFRGDLKGLYLSYSA